MITLCEMKHQVRPIGIEVVKDVERKATVLSSKFPSRTIQKILITTSEPTRDLSASGYFYRIIQARELLDSL